MKRPVDSHTPERQPSSRVDRFMDGTGASIQHFSKQILGALPYRPFSVPGTPGHHSLKSIGIPSRVSGILKLMALINQKTSLGLRRKEPEL